MTMFFDTLEYLLSNSSTLECGDEFSDRVIKRVAYAETHPTIPGTKYRASSVGRPWILQVLDRWYGQSRRFNVGNMVTMLNGRVAQEILAEILSLTPYGFEQEKALHYLGITGHADFIVQGGGNEVMVLECKSMASHLITSFRNAPHDNYGYLSQLAFYWACAKKLYPTKDVTAAFVLFNRDQSKFSLVGVTQQVMQQKIERIEQATQALTQVADYDVDALLATVMIPPTFGGKIPDSMVRSRWVPVLYHNQGEGWEVDELERIAMRLKQLPQERKDLVPLDGEE